MVGKLLFIGVGLLFLGVAYYYYGCLFDGEVLENDGRVIRVRYREKGAWQEAVFPAELIVGFAMRLLPGESVQVIRTKQSALLMQPKKTKLVHTRRQRIVLCVLVGAVFLLGGILA